MDVEENASVAFKKSTYDLPKRKGCSQNFILLFSTELFIMHNLKYEIYAVIQMGVMGWQVKEVRDRQWEYEGRQLPATGGF
ncbi:hypothetical protein ANCCEY_09165 [Ancylostoma ceylanicum]|uniref:Uncharacterized protein n=1 Tax=Ancylostoma ceylanicum TaxID=53326 RepID=A0A0D6LKV7_9BILA|nr:hypothetical protein ANCCEY_09165 [Ancylostoma ceylanicum]